MGALELKVADLQRRLDQSSVNSSVPPSKDRLGKRKPKRDRRGADAAGDDGSQPKRKRGGQPGRRGSGLRPASGGELAGEKSAPPPSACGGCGGTLSDADAAGHTWAQVWDIAPVRLDKWHWVLPKRRCGCGEVSTAVVPGVGWAHPGTVAYGSNVNAAVAVISNYGTVPAERCADMMGMLLNAPVSTGFVCTAVKRLATALTAGGYDAAVKAALARAEVLAADETPVEVITGNTDADGNPVPGSPHILTVGDPTGLQWLTAIGSRSSAALAAAGVLDSFTGVLVRDDYNGYTQFDPQLDAVQLCNAHLLREAQGVADIGDDQQWATIVIDILNQANQARDQAITNGHHRIDDKLLTTLRHAYDHAVADGLAVNTGREWAGPRRHPGYRLAKRLRDKANQVWTFTTRFDVPFTNNTSEQALRMSKVRQKISGCWHTLDTLSDWCRIRSYLVNTRNHNINPIDAINNALTGNPWLPALNTS